VIKAARARLDKMQPAGAMEEKIYRMDPITNKLDVQKWEKGKKLPPGYQRMEDENNDGVPDAMQPQGQGGATAAPNKAILDRLFGGSR
jgi:hypothetical protein